MQKGRDQKIYSILFFFTLGVVAGFWAIKYSESCLPGDAALSDWSVWYGREGGDVDGKALFCFLLFKRWKTFFFIVIFSTTYLGYLYCTFCAIWYGMTSGVYFSLLFMKYGWKGIFWGTVGILPQYLIYFPTFLFLLAKCERIYECIYIQKGDHNLFYGEKSTWRRVLGGITIAALLVLLGCFLESYVNPILVRMVVGQGEMLQKN